MEKGGRHHTSGFSEHPQETFVADDAETVMARRAADALRQALPVQGDVTLTLKGKDGEASIILPTSAVSMILETLDAMADQTPVSIIPANAILTVEQAADELHVSQSFLVNLLEEGQIPFHMKGSHHRIRWSDLRRFKLASKQIRLQAIADMIAESKRLGLE